jgi:hypothetical protein
VRDGSADSPIRAHSCGFRVREMNQARSFLTESHRARTPEHAHRTLNGSQDSTRQIDLLFVVKTVLGVGIGARAVCPRARVVGGS